MYVICSNAIKNRIREYGNIKALYGLNIDGPKDLIKITTQMALKTSHVYTISIKLYNAFSVFLLSMNDLLIS
jgi:hypothetical protein